MIRKVYEFSEQVQEIKNKLSDDIQDKLERTSEDAEQTRRMNEIIEFEKKFSHLATWMSNIGEAFLTHHRDMGVDVVYVADYVDSHQSMASDLREKEAEFRLLVDLNRNG